MNIDNDILIYDKITEHYKTEDFQEILKSNLKVIFAELQRVLKQNAKNYDLCSQNSVREGYYFSFTSRIKESDSFREKLVRKNEGLNFINKLGLTSISDVERERNLIEKEIKLFEDILGIKIITELQADCKSVYNLLLDKLDLLNDKKISFKDFHDQPTKMKNGLDIFNIKGIYNSEYAFELQIKSKISSAWGDMDHTLFYKDYSITPIRDSVQVSMNNIGLLLNQLESFLLDIRKSNNDYETKSHNLNLIKRFDEEFSCLVKDKLKTYYDISKISPFLIYIFTYLEGTSDKLDSLNYDQLSYTTQDPIGQKYLLIRKKSYELVLLEVIFMNWKQLFKKFDNTQENYEANLKDFLTSITCYLKSQFPDTELEYFEKIILVLLTYCENPNIFLRENLYKNLLQINKFISSHIDLEDESINENQFQLFLNMFHIVLFSGNIDEFLNILTEEIPIDIVYLLINKIKDKIVTLDTSVPFNKLLDNCTNSIIERLNEKMIEQGGNINE